MKDDDIEILDFDEEIIYTKKKVVVQKKVLINDDFIGKASIKQEEIKEIRSKVNDIKKKEIELIDDEDNDNKSKIKGNNKEKKLKVDAKKKNGKRKYTRFEKMFLIFSILFILISLGFYGYRTYYYYHKTHDIVKNITIKDKLTALENIAYQGDGLYEKNGYFYFKGTDINNYVYYSGRLFRIIDIDNDIRMIEENTNTNLIWGVDSNYNDSSVNKWLNNYLNTFKDYDLFLTKNKWCNEKIEIENYDCKDTVEEYVGLLSVSDYLQAGAKNSFLNNGTYFWTLNQDIDGHSLYINSEGNINNLYKKEDTYFSYGIRPVITLKGDISIVSGDGSINSPFIVEELGNALLRDNSVGNYVTYQGDSYRILSIDDKGVSLIYDGVLDVNKKYNDVYKYLNSDFIKKLNKDDLVKLNYNSSEYSSNNKYLLNDKKSSSNYVIIPSIGELFMNDYNGYWLND